MSWLLEVAPCTCDVQCLDLSRLGAVLVIAPHTGDWRHDTVRKLSVTIFAAAAPVLEMSQ